MCDVIAAKSLSKKCKEKYYKKYFPNNDVVPYNCYANENRIKPVRYTDLKGEEIWGMPFAFYRDEKDRLTALFQNIAHSLIIGTTQVGKTWGMVINSIYLLSQKQNSANFMITDPKGEISQHTVEHLKKRGYDVFALNFKDTRYTNMWNPLVEIYDEFIVIKDIDEQIEYHDSLKTLYEYTLAAKPEEYQKTGVFYVLDGIAYEELKAVQRAVEDKKNSVINKTATLINQLVNSIGADAVEKSKDISWPMGALEILRGMIYLMLEDAVDERSGFTRKNMNFMNMSRYYDILREQVLSGNGNNYMSQPNKLLDVNKLRHKKDTDTSIKMMRSYFENAATTARSYMGIFANIMQNWFEPKLFAVANENNIDLSRCDEKPFALFLITCDYEDSDYFIAGLFIDWVYKQMIERADRGGGKLKREMFFILDEFANIPIIGSFTSKITTSLSRRIIFHLYVQSYEQIETNYGHTQAESIRNNCNVEFFLGSQSYSTKKSFSEKCGEKKIPSLEASLVPDCNSTEKIPVIPINELENLGEGDMYMKKLNYPPVKTHFERTYKCKELEHNIVPFEEMLEKPPTYYKEDYIYKYLEGNESLQEFYTQNNDAGKREIYKFLNYTGG